MNTLPKIALGAWAWGNDGMKRAILLFITCLLMCAVQPVCVVAEETDAVSSVTISVTSLPPLQENENAHILVVYFSTDDTVKAVARVAADALEADIFEIVPEQPYTEADLAYYTNGRCDQEQADAAARPGIAEWPESLEQYDVIFIGYPIWHGQAPKILYTFLEGVDLSEKTVVPFCTSMSSGTGSSAVNLAKLTGEKTTWLKAERIANHSTDEQIRAWSISALNETKK